MTHWNIFALIANVTKAKADEQNAISKRHWCLHFVEQFMQNWQLCSPITLFFAVNIADETDLCAVVLNKSSRNNNKNPHHRLLQFTIQRCRNVKCIIDLPMKDFVMMIVITIIRSHQPHGFSLLVAIHIFNTFNRWHSTYCFKSLAIRFELVIWKINKTLAFFTSLPGIFFSKFD